MLVMTLTCSKRLCFFHFNIHLNPPDLFALLQENMQRSAGMRGDAEGKKGAPPHPHPLPPPAGHSVAAGKEQQQREMTFTLYLNSLSGWRKTCRHPERSRPPSGRGGTAGGGTSPSGSPRFMQIVSRVCVVLSTSRLARPVDGL